MDRSSRLHLENEESILEYTTRRLDIGDSMKKIATTLGCHRNTLAQKLKREYGSHWKGVRNCRNYTIDDICGLILAHVPVKRHASNWGQRHVSAALRRCGYRISREKVREAVRILQPDQVQRRQVRNIWRAVYDIVAPMHMWHIDSYDKLSPWGFRIHAAIDGATHYVVYAVVATNKRSETIFAAYESAVQKFCHPLCIRSDYASEHNLIRKNIEQARPGIGRNRPFRVGPSVHNQRIERFWRQLKEKLAFYYKTALLQLGDEGSLDLRDPVHRACLLQVFLPTMEQDLFDWIDIWNHHKVRTMTENGRSIPQHIPAQAFQAYERERKEILCPPYEEGTFQPSSPDLSDNDNPDASSRISSDNEDDHFILEQGMVDISSQDLKLVRDRAYVAHRDQLPEITARFKFFLGLTVLCLEAEEARLPILDTSRTS